MRYGKALRVVRGAREISQKDLAAETGLDASFVSLIEAGKREPSARTLAVLCKALEVPVYLFTLLASEADELRGITERQAAVLGRNLLAEVLTSGGKRAPRKAKRVRP